MSLADESNRKECLNYETLKMNLINLNDHMYMYLHHFIFTKCVYEVQADLNGR